MTIPKSIGFPSMREEQGEKRAFLPDFIGWLAEMGVEIFLEEGYGKKLGFDFSDYQQGVKNIVESSREDVFQQDVVILLRSPKLEELALLRRGSILISMLHYHTRPKRVRRLKELGINAISLDSITSGDGIRLVQNMRAVAWNGIDAAFDVLEKEIPNLYKADGEPFRTLILGTGMVGKHAADAVSKLGNRKRNDAFMASGGAGSLAIRAGRNFTGNTEKLKELLSQIDILVDATQRKDTSQPILPNAYLKHLPEYAIIVDLVVDPYTVDISPPVVRGIEGIPQGNLDQYIFYPDDSNWSMTIPSEIPTDIRRTSISCYSWPGIHPEKCMRHYAGQLRPLMRILLQKGYQNLSSQGGHFERALKRGSLHSFLSGGEVD